MFHAEIAQLVEQRIRNAWVVGSSPILGSRFKFIFTHMSQHPSFRLTGGSAAGKRNVLKRFERMELLKKRGQWKNGQSLLGLRKTKP